MSDMEARIEALERKVRVLEDALELQGIMDRYGPAVDSGDADAAADLFWDDGVYDAEGVAPMMGAEAVRAMVEGPAHQGLLPNAAHTVGPSMLRVDGDAATATGYSRVYLREGEGFRLWRVAANRWEFERRGGGWKVARRTNRLIGTKDSHEVLASASR